MKQLIYIAGPMTGIKDWNRPAFADAAKRLTAAGIECIDPAAVDNPDEELEWHMYLRRDLPIVCGCSGLALLPGWWRSKGARLEFNTALELGMEIRELEEWLECR